MNTILTTFLCAMLVALTAPAGADTQPIRKEAPLAITQPSPEIGTKLKLQQESLEPFKVRLDSQDKRIGDLGFYIALFGTLITGIVVFFSIRSTREAVLAAKDEARKEISGWIGREGKSHIDEQIKPEIDVAIQQIHRAASYEIDRLQKNIRQSEGLIKILSNQIQIRIPSTPEQERRIKDAAAKLDSIAPQQYGYDDWMTLAFKAIQEEKYEIAAENFGKAVDVSDTPMEAAPALLNKGVALSKLGKNEDAIATYNEVAHRYGNRLEAPLREVVARALLNKGIKFGETEMHDEAIAAYDEVVKRYGDVSEADLRGVVAMALVNMGASLSKLGKNEDAIAAYNDVVNRYGNAPEADLREVVANALLNMGVALGEQGKIDEAITVYSEVVQRYGNAPEAVLRECVAMALVNKGIRLRDMEKYIEAVAVFDEVAKRYGDAPEAVLREQVDKAQNRKGVTRLYEAKKRWQAGDTSAAGELLKLAREDVESALARKPDWPMALGNRGYILFLQGHAAEAEAALAQAIRLGGEELRQDELKDADIHTLPQDEAFKQLINSL